MKNVELLHKALKINHELNESIGRLETAQISSLLKEFILSNELQANMKFNLYDFVGKDGMRPAMTGVFHSEGFQIATDAHTLVVIKSAYPEDMEGKIVTKKGEIIDAVYPNYRNVIPNDEGLTFSDFDCSKVLEIEKQYKLDIKEDKEKSPMVRVENVYFNILLLAKVARFAKAHGITQIGLSDPNRTAKFSGGENVAIIMPMMCSEDSIYYTI